MTIRAWAIFTAVSLACACKVDVAEDAGGCTKNDDCRHGRSCIDRICTYPEEAERLEAARAPAERVFDALVAAEPRYYAGAWPMGQDYDWGFDLDSPGDDPGLDRAVLIEKRENKFNEDFSGVLDRCDWEKAVFVRFEPGRFAPIPKGRDRARRPLERLVDSRVVYKLNGREGELGIAELIRLRGRWRLFALIE